LPLVLPTAGPVRRSNFQSNWPTPPTIKYGGNSDDAFTLIIPASRIWLYFHAC
jgi:hypothetical protein